ncbi:MAG: DUF1428 family protein [Actinobacteria bacterium]|nr:DUF1428 family protein [Actinomycetota bacterium]
MFCSIYVFRVSKGNLDAFIDAQREAATLFQDHGSLEDATFVALDTSAKYGCEPFDQALTATDEEAVIVVGLDRFEDRETYERAMKGITEDDRFQRLDEIVGEALGDAAGLALRGEFERVIG